MVWACRPLPVESGQVRWILVSESGGGMSDGLYALHGTADALRAAARRRESLVRVPLLDHHRATELAQA